MSVHVAVPEVLGVWLGDSPVLIHSVGLCYEGYPLFLGSSPTLTWPLGELWFQEGVGGAW